MTSKDNNAQSQANANRRTPFNIARMYIHFFADYNWTRGKPFYVVFLKSQTLTLILKLLSQVCLNVLGESPYPGVLTGQMAGLLQAGYRMPRPRHISAKL